MQLHISVSATNVSEYLIRQHCTNKAQNKTATNKYGKGKERTSKASRRTEATADLLRKAKWPGADLGRISSKPLTGTPSGAAARTRMVPFCTVILVEIQQM